MSHEVSEEDLQKIREWNPLDTNGVLQFIRERWEYPERVHEEAGILYLSTCGWSGNEELIGALESNQTAWSLCWVQSRRGGHYQFELKGQKKGESDGQC